MTTPSLPIKRANPWKSVAIVSFFGGVGIALSLCLIFGGVYWYNTRPKPWKSEAIKARLVQTTFFPVHGDYYQRELSKPRSGEPPENSQRSPVFPKGRLRRIVGNMKVRLVFDLANTTAYDYTLQPPTAYGPFAMERLKSTLSLARNNLMTWSEVWGGNYGAETKNDSILIPAHQTVRVLFSNEYLILEDEGSQKDWKNDEVQKQYVQEMLKDIDSFVILDEMSHYRIELPLKDAVK